MTTPANLTQLPDTLFRMNTTNKLVIRIPPLYQAVVPITHQLAVDELPDLAGVPDDQVILDQHLDIIQDQLDTTWRPLRDGYLYIFRNDTLWAEYRATFDPHSLTTTYQAIDLITTQGLDQRAIDDAHTPAPYVLIPKEGRYQIAYSEGQWPWLRIQLLGGLHKDHQIPAFGIPEPAQDPNLIDWSPQIASALRTERCITQSPSTLPDQGLLHPLERQSQTPTPLFPAEFVATVPELAACQNHQDALQPEQWVADWVLLPVKDPLLIGQQMSTHLKTAWHLLQTVTTNMQDASNTTYPYAKFYESAVLAYQVFYTRGELPKGKTRWQQDQYSDEAFKHLSLEDIQSALALDLRRSLYQLISHWQTRLAQLLNGDAQWQKWDTALRATLDDYWAMTDLPGPIGGDDEDTAYWGYAHRRWYHLSALLTLLGTPPQATAKLIERDPIGLELAADAEKSPGPQLIAALLTGKHTLSELAFNAPQVALYRFQMPLTELAQRINANAGQAYSDTLYQQERELLAALRTEGKPRANLYRPDAATQHQKKRNQDTQDKEGQVEPSTLIKVSLSTIRLASSVLGTLGGSAIKLTGDTLRPNQLNTTVERLRHAFNTVQETHLRYTSFDTIYQNKLEHGTQIIATFLTSAKQQRTEEFALTSPDEFATQQQTQLDTTIDDLKRRHATERRNLKKQLRDELLPEYKKQFTHEQNQLRSSLADLSNQKAALQNEMNQVVRQYNDGSGNVEIMEASAERDPDYLRLAQERLAADGEYQVQRQRWNELDQAIAGLDADITALKNDIEASARSGKDIDALDTLIEQDRVQYQRSHDPAHPLHELLQQDQQHLNQRAELQANTTEQISTHSQHYDKTVHDIEQQGRLPINTSTPEGRELLNFYESQTIRLEQARKTEIITSSSATDFEAKQAEFDTSPNHIVLDEYQSTLWNEQLQGNYLVLEGGEHLYAADPSQGVAKNALRDASLSSALLAFDALNLYNITRVVFGTSDKATSGRNITDLVANILGTASSIADFWQIVHSHRAYLSNAEKLSTTYGQVMLGRTLSTTALNTAKFLGYCGTFSAGLGIAVGLLDFVENRQEGDDAMYADAVMVVGGVLGFAGMVTTSLVLGPIGIVVGVAGVLLKTFVFKEDNLLQTWLEQGPFSADKPVRASHLIPMRDFGLTEITLKKPGQDTFALPGFETRAVMDHLSALPRPELDTAATISHYLTSKFSTLKDEHGKPLPDLQLTGRILGSLILDQNYKPLGLMYSEGHMTSSMPKFWLQPHDNTIYIKQQSKLIPCAEIGNPIAANKAAVSQHLDNLINKVLGNSIASDTSDRFSDRWWEFDDEEFTKPMTREGHEGTASLELLLNGLFPVKTKLSMQALDANGQVMHKRFGRAAIAAGYTPFKGEIDSIRFIVEIDAPYFVEGQSSLHVQITESPSVFSKEISVDSFRLQLQDTSTKKSRTTLTISHFSISATSEPESDGDYLLPKSNKLCIIRTLKYQHVSDLTDDLKSMEFVCWTRITSSANNDLFSKSDVFFPYRKNEVFENELSDKHTDTWATSDPRGL
ncbi:toxin VasX [Ketobacter alkanivorans]|uniref:Toxin VasX N-terminal region domain-containing protein n=1 Tax=Ketobacter alkanivorans TaxID=1917421 RepID=A0A2K9LMB8_9GAMM|nr:toxin VasX [Ketobacter alkanivorans]AUM13432.1 hypothetical protein Kalk_13815 [Ketobacter alkanivorans]